MSVQTKRKRAAKSKGFKIKPIPLTEDQIKLFVDHYKKFKRFPGSKIPCTVTGKLTTCVGPWMNKKIKQFGSAENLLRNYVCRGVLKDKRIKSLPPKTKRTRKLKELVAKEQDRYDIPTMDSFVKPRPYDAARESESICLRPDIYLSNDRHCDGCHHFKICRNSHRTLPKHVLFDGEKFTYESGYRIKATRKR
jgi:hypothetical protein